MPPKAKIDKQKIIDTCLDFVRENGVEAINAREIAKRLDCSTQPIFSNFKNMDELKNEVYKSAFDLYTDHIKGEMASEKYPKYKASGMAYISFAKNEKEIFKLLFMSKREKSVQHNENEHWAEITELISSIYNVTMSQADELHSKMWIFVHGIATMCATDFLEFDEQNISQMISDVYIPLIDALKG